MNTEPLEDEQSAQLLAQANLHRMRKQWDEAMTSCMQVLYHAPDNWRAHSLLGDIYTDLGRSEEAIQWYCMTLDIRPESKSVRDKLSALVNYRRHEIAKSLDPTRPLIDRTGKLYINSRRGRWSWYWSSPERRRMFTVGAVIVVVVCAVFAPTKFAGRSAKTASEGVFTTGTTPTNTSLVLTPVSAIPSPSTSTPLPASTAVSPYTTASAAAAPPQASLASGEMRDSNDESLTLSLQNDLSLKSRGIQVSDAQLDPSTQKVTVTFLALGTTATGEQARDLQDSITVARAVLIRPETASVSSVVTRCLTLQQRTVAGASGAPSALLIFLGTITRGSSTAAPADLDALTADQLTAYFESTWWQSTLPS